jgi:hypothetical protein
MLVEQRMVKIRKCIDWLNYFNKLSRAKITKQLMHKKAPLTFMDRDLTDEKESSLFY